MRLEPFAPSDIPALLRLARACKAGLGYLDARGWREQLFGDPDSDAGALLKAVEKKRLLGVALGLTRRVKGARHGWIKALGVDPRARRQGVGRALLEGLERRFRQRGAAEARIGACPPPYVDGGVALLDTASHCFYLAQGYQRSGTVIDMQARLGRLRPLSAADQKALKAAGGRKAGPADAPALAAMVARAFPQWSWETQAALRQGVAWVAGPRGTVTAFACADATHPGWFGPMGTLPRERGNGLGRLLMAQCLQHLKRRGYAQARIPWVGPVPFYERHAGAALGPVFWTFAKRL